MNMHTVDMNIAMPSHQVTLRHLNKTCTLSILYSNRKAPVVKTAVPEGSLLSMVQQYNYRDSYLTTFNDASNVVEPADLAYAFHSAAPGWIKVFILLRNLLRAHFSFKIFKNIFRRKAVSDEHTIRVGEKIHFFTMLHHTDNEIVFGKIGRHIDIRYALFLHKPRKNTLQKNVVISTAVTLHTYFGRFCFIILKPLLAYLGPFLLKRTVNRLKAL